MAEAMSDEELFEDLRPGSSDEDETLPGKTTQQAAADDPDADLDPPFEDLSVGLDAALGATEEGAAPADGAPSDDDDISQHTERVQKRIMRERRLKQAERERAEAAEAQVAELAEKVNELSTKFSQIEQQGSKAKLAEQLTAAKSKLADLKTQYRQARVDGDVDAELRLHDEINEIDFQRRLMEAAAQQQAAAPARAAADTTPAAAAKPKAQPSPQTQAWLERNKGWYGKDAVLTAAAQAIDKEVFRESGYTPNDPEYFAELDRRMVKRGLRRPAASAARSPVAGAGGGGGAPTGDRPQSNRVTLTAADKATMRQFRLDPTNPAHVKQFAVEKRAASQRSE